MEVATFGLDGWLTLLESDYDYRVTFVILKKKGTWIGWRFDFEFQFVQNESFECNFNYIEPANDAPILGWIQNTTLRLKRHSCKLKILKCASFIPISNLCRSC